MLVLRAFFILLATLLIFVVGACSSPVSPRDSLETLGGAHFASSTLTRGSLIANFTVRGVGNPGKSGYQIGFVATADVTATCANKGNTEAVGVNDVSVSADIALPTTGSIDRNGTFTGSVTLQDVSGLSSTDICKNRNWTITALKTRWKSAVLTIYRPDAEPDDKVCFIISKDDGVLFEFARVSCSN